MSTNLSPPNLFDRLVGYLSPSAGLRRLGARTTLSRLSASTSGYEADTPSRLRKFHTNQQSPNQLAGRSAVALRNQARQMQRNNDIARGILRTMVNNIVGPGGIGIEPQPRRADGGIHNEYAKALREAYLNWARAPEVTGKHTFAKVQRLMAAAWLRDGEAFAQELIGAVPGLQHGSNVPFSLEMFEADMVPYYFSQGTVQHGIDRNTWGRATGYYVFKTHPAESMAALSSDLKRIQADRVHHIALLDRIGQMRGVSEFASIITRLEDIKDYEESERIAAKISAALTAYVKKSSPDGYVGPETDSDGNPKPRQLAMSPGMVIDGLSVGEEIGLIDSKRPNPNLITFRQGQLRAVAAGVGASYSSIARDYNGTFSAQRQELVEQWVHYATLTDEFVGMFVQPVWATFVQACDLSGIVRRPRDVRSGSEDDALFLAQSMPWIDPAKEAAAYVALVRAGFASEVEVIRKRGGNPRDVLEQITTWRKEAQDRDLVLTSDGRNAETTGTAPAQDPQAAQAQAAAANKAHQDMQARLVADTASRAELMAHTASLQAAVATVVAREPASVVMHAAPITVNTPATTVQNAVQPTPLQVDLHASVAAPQVAVHNDVQPASVVVQHPARAVAVHERDPETQEIIQTVTTYSTGGEP